MTNVGKEDRRKKPPTNLGPRRHCLWGDSDFPLGRSPPFSLGHYLLSPQFLRARNKPKDPSKEPAENTSGIRKSFLADRLTQTMCANNAVRISLYGGSLGLWKVRRTARRPLAVTPRGMDCRCVAQRNSPDPSPPRSLIRLTCPHKHQDSFATRELS